MNKKHLSFLSIIVILCSFTLPVLAATSQREAINDLGNYTAKDLPIPVLFGVSIKNLTRNFGEPRLGHAHEGLDIMAPEGTPIVSPTNAVVTKKGVWPGAGNFVTTAVSGDETFTYMHLSEIANIDQGDVLKVGDIIGYVGHTGNAIASAPHLHFEIRDQNDMPIDPYPRLTKVFSLGDKIQYIDVILNEVADKEKLAELLVTKFRSEFVSAKAQAIDLPSDIQKALQKISTPTVVVGSSTGTLRVGSRGAEVVTLQKFLIQNAVGSAPRVVADGAFGPITRQAVVDYQASVGLTADGIYGPISRAYALAHA